MPVDADSRMTFPLRASTGEVFDLFSIPVARGGNATTALEVYVVVIEGRTARIEPGPRGWEALGDIAARLATVGGVTSLALDTAPVGQLSGSRLEIAKGESKVTTIAAPPPPTETSRSNVTLRGVLEQGSHAEGFGLVLRGAETARVGETGKCALQKLFGKVLTIRAQRVALSDGTTRNDCVAVTAVEDDPAVAALARAARAEEGSGCNVPDECEQQCAKGRPGACTTLADAYFRGNGVRRDQKKAIPLFVRACEAGNANACNAAGFAYAGGGGARRDLPRAKRYMKKACDGGSKPSCDDLEAIECVVDALSPAKRSPTMDPFCNIHRGRPARPGESMPNSAFGAGAGSDFEGLQVSACFPRMRVLGCTLTRSQRLDQVAWCCPPP